MVRGAPAPPPRLVVPGWAARVQVLPHGRRQFLSFVLPGDLLGLHSHRAPVAASTIVALTEVERCPAPIAKASPALERIYAIDQVLEEAYLLDQIMRLGRMNAQERILDLFIELHERLNRAGLVEHGDFEAPRTQEGLGDALGLTPTSIA